MEESQKKILKQYNFITLKPQIYVCNVYENSVLKGNSLSKIVEEYAVKKKSKVMNISAAIESDIAEIIDEKEKIEFLKSIGMKETSLTRLIKAGYDLLDLITFYIGHKGI